MYVPAHFALTDPEALRRVIRDRPLGILVTHGAAGLDANHLPFELAPDDGPLGTLRAHVARANPVWREVADGAPVMVVFRGVEGYVSPSWYPSKHETHRQVPTWNYEVVHAHGPLSIRDDEAYVRGVVARLTRAHEAAEPRPWKMGDAPADYLDAMLGAIVGLEVRIERIEGKAKLSQNKDARDRLGAVEALDARGRDALARAMRDAPAGGGA
jgi:transcriptional regulator